MTGAWAGAGFGGGSHGRIAGRVGFWDVLLHLGSWAPNLHVRLSVKGLVGLEND